MSSWPLLQALKPGLMEPSLREWALEMIESGEIAFHMLPFTTHTEFTGVEEFIKGVWWSAALAKSFGKNVISAKMTDVPGHTRMLPSLLSKAGVKFLHLGCNVGCMPPDVQTLFHWQGPDGWRVLTFYNKGGYGSGLLPPEGWPYPVWLALMQTGDNIGPHDPTVIAGLVEKARRKCPGVEIVTGTLDDFYRELTPFLGEEIPVVTQDLADTWIHGVGSYPAEVSSLRRARILLGEAEKVLALTGRVDRREGIASAHEQSLLFGEHTWGLDVKITLGYGRHYEKNEFERSLVKPAVRRLEASWDEQRDRSKAISGAAALLSSDALNTLAASVEAEGPRLVACNGLNRQKSGWTDVDAWKDVLKGTGLKYASSGISTRCRKHGGRLEVYVENVPALGYTTLLADDNASPALCPYLANLCRVRYDAASGIFENDFLRAEVDIERLSTLHN